MNDQSMKIAMFSNTYLPHVGGVAQSVSRFSDEFEKHSHRVLIVAPAYDRNSNDEKRVVRIPALQNFNGSDFSVVLPIHPELSSALDDFGPDLIHSHHPFLIGNTALRLAASRNLPLVFTHHTMYEHYTHYVPLAVKSLQKYVIELSTGYANLCHGVIAPSQSVADILKERGVTVPMAVIPSGVDLERFSTGDGQRFRTRYKLPADAWLIGHVGRLAEEKNLEFLATAVARAVKQMKEKAYFVVVGTGPAENEIRIIVNEHGIADRTRLVGTLTGQELLDAYQALDLFTFTSMTETQGMVIVEAMAAGTPVLALDAPGAREVVEDGQNGRLMKNQDVQEYADAVIDLATRPPSVQQSMRDHARQTAKRFTTTLSAEKTLHFYEQIRTEKMRLISFPTSDWEALLQAMRQEWELWANRARALSKAIAGD